MISDHQASRWAALLPHGRGAALLTFHFLAALIVLAIVLYLLTASWLAGLTIPEWRNAPAGSAIDVMSDEPTHPPWNW